MKTQFGTRGGRLPEPWGGEGRPKQLSHIFEGRFEKLFREAPEYMSLMRENRAFVDVNKAFERITGYRREEVVGRTAAELGLWADAVQREAMYRALERDGSVMNVDFALRRRDGTVVPHVLDVVSVELPEGRCYFFLGHDITQRKRGEEALRAEKERLRVITDNVPAAIAYTDAGGRVRYANRQCIQFYGHPGAASEGRPLRDVIGEANFAAARAALQRALAGESVHYEGDRRRVDGALRAVDVTLVPHLGDGGKVLGAYTFIVDVTERRRAEDALRASEAQLRLVADSVPANIAYFGADLRYRYANRRYREFFTGSADAIEGKTVEEVLGEENWGPIRERVEHALRGDPVSYRGWRRRADGQSRYVSVSLVPHQDDRGDVLGLYTLVVDTTDHYQAEKDLRLRNRALEASINSIMITEPCGDDQRIVYVNPAFERTTGYTEAEVLGRDPGFLHGEDIDQPAIEALRVAARGRREETALLRNYRKDGTMFWNELHVAPVPDESGRVAHFIGVANDVTERVRYQEDIERHANYDTLTELPNRNLLRDRLSQAMVQTDRSGRSLAVLFLDLDHLKRINDSLGHEVGDAVITAMGKRLAEQVRSGDTVARIGGDEFVIVLADMKRDDNARHVASKLLQSVAQPLKTGRHDFVLSASIGIALYPKDGADAGTLLRHADTALYRAKEQGRACFRFFAPEMNDRVVKSLDLEQDLRKALDAGEFSLQYQPIVRLPSSEVVGLEALIRWKRKDGTLVPPAQFISVAEDAGLIVPIGRWVLETAAQQAADWNRSGRKGFFVAVNLSTRQFRDAQLLDSVRAALGAGGVDPRLIKLEITESAVMQDAEGAERLLHELKSLGVLLSVDDFGTGYSSLSYLKRFPIDTLKIDRSFVRGLPDDRNDLAISRAVIELAHGMHLNVVAEGIESAEQASLLAAHGCDFAQGYLFGRPCDPKDLRLPI